MRETNNKQEKRPFPALNMIKRKIKNKMEMKMTKVMEVMKVTNQMKKEKTN